MLIMYHIQSNIVFSGSITIFLEKNLAPVSNKMTRRSDKSPEKTFQSASKFLRRVNHQIDGRIKSANQKHDDEVAVIHQQFVMILEDQK